MAAWIGRPSKCKIAPKFVWARASSGRNWTAYMWCSNDNNNNNNTTTYVTRYSYGSHLIACTLQFKSEPWKLIRYIPFDTIFPLHFFYLKSVMQLRRTQPTNNRLVIVQQQLFVVHMLRHDVIQSSRIRLCVRMQTLKKKWKRERRRRRRRKKISCKS